MTQRSKFKISGATCSGYLPDFDTVVVTLVWDFTTNQWALACSSGSG